VNLAAGRASLISEESGHSVAGLAAADPSPSDLQLYGEPERPLSPNSPSAAQHPIGDETAGLDQLQATLARLNQALGEAPQAEAASEVPAGGIDLAVPDLLSDLPAELQPEAPEMTDALLRRPFEKLAQLKEDKAPPEDIAHAYLALGHFYRERIEAGEAAPAVVAAAIEAYEEALCWLPDLHEAWGNALNDLGTLYWMQSQYYGDRDELLAGLQRSLETYQTGLTKINQKLQSDVASRLYSNMGAVYSTLAAYDNSVENLKQAIRAYRQALPFCSVEVQMEEYAMLQNSLGSVYWKLSHYEQPKSCLHRAIAAYNEALRCRHPEEAPLDYAAVQNNLGIAYWSLSKHERTVFLLKHAIAAYRDALNYRTPSTDPAACASTYNNLGTAYWELANQLDDSADPKNRYRQNAVIAYEAALKAAQHLPPDQPIGLDLPSIHHCLGNVYDQLAQTADGAEAIATQLNQGLQHYLQALAQQTASSVNYEPIFKALVRNVRNHYEKLGLNGQQQALGKLPAHLLPEVLQSL
jgi:tetratricopeptide (TPR) repeat protein